MASKPRDLVVRFLSDVRGFLRGTDQVSDALDEVVRDQQRAADEGDDAARRIAAAYKRAADKIKRENDNVERDTRSTFREAGQEAGQEFAQNLGESISSGDLTGLASGTAGGLAATFGAAGPVGLAIAGLGALGVSVFQSLSTSAANLQASTQAAFDNLLSAADEFATQQTQLETAFGKGDYVANLAEARRLANEYGLDVTEVVRLIGEGNRGQQRLAELQAEVNRITDKSVANGGELTNLESRRRLAAQQILDATNRSSDAIRGAVKAQEETERLQGKSADAAERRAAAEERAATAVERQLSALGRFYAAAGSSFSATGSVTQQQLGAAGRYVKGKR